jgi:ubiquinone/menaquinone biosynthesis C-methylase UbiE
MSNTLEREIDKELEAAIDPWLEHMRWRPDFSKWREGRLWQEKKQKRTLGILSLFLQEAYGKGSSRADLKGLRVLDLGCGMGGLSTALALEGALVTSMDYNPAYCGITRLRGQRYDLSLSPVNAAGEALPFANGAFDVVICMDVLEHVQQPEKMLAEINRVLQPKGLLYFTAINRYAFNDPHYHVRGVNWLPRRMASRYLSLFGRQKDNSRFRDRQTLDEMHYYRFGDLLPLARRHRFNELKELGELELSSAGENLKGWKKKLYRGLQQARLLVPAYRLYRAYYKGTYQLMLLKEAR